MQPRQSLKKIQKFFSTFLSKITENKSFFLLSIFLIVILLISFIIPQLNFGRFYGSDGYSHIINTDRLASSRGLSEFYEYSQDFFEDPSDPSNGYNYPFGLWLFGATLTKITGLPTITAGFFYCTIFLLILVGSFYVYSSIWLESREQKLFAVLFLISMPQFSIILMNYSPSIFILPFLFITLFFIFKEPVNWKLLPIAWLSMFIIVISHTGTFMFLLSFSLAFFLLYCLIWGKFSKPLYTAIISILLIYVFALSLFPNIVNQYKVKSTMFLLPGNFLANTFNFQLPGDLVRVFYQNLLVQQQLTYVIILATILFFGGKILIYIHRKTATILSKSENFPAFILPIQNLSHSVSASPLWLGPVQVIFSVFGFFHLDNKGKCLLFTALLTTLLPDLLQASQGISTLTGSLREISYLVIIIPITATLGFWHILAYLYDPESKIKTWISSALWVVVCLVIIITPTIGTTYYLPTLSGEDYVIDGLKWLGATGDQNEYVEGWLLRPVGFYTNMTSGAKGLRSGTETKTFLTLLRGIYFMPGDQIQKVEDLQKKFGVKYILSTDRMLRYFGGTTETLTIDSNSALNKIYASNDFGIYEASSSSVNPVPESYVSNTSSIKYQGGTYQIETKYYKVTLGANTPVLKRFGPPDNDLLNYGFITEDFRITGTELSTGGDLFKLEDLEFTHDIKDNQITYRTVLISPQSQVPIGTLLIRYTFYPDVIKRDYILSNDWLVAKSSPQINVYYTLRSFSLLRSFVVKNDQTRLERQTVVYEDSVSKNVNIEDFYLHDGDLGMYIAFAGLSPQPSSISYSGSLYNRSHIAISQSIPVKPGASFLSTQFISTGSEYFAKKNIQNREGIELIPYPDGINPILLSGYPSTQPDSFINEKITSGYGILNNNSIPYAEVINPSTDLERLLTNNITLIGSQRSGATDFDDYTTQETNMMALKNYTNNQGVSFAGFMPDAFNYNLETLTILSNHKTPYIFSSPVSATLNGEYAKGYRIPQIAYIYSEPTGVVLFPVSYPKSDTLLSPISSETVFSSWKATIDSAADNDELVLLLIRSQDIGDPIFTESFIQLFSYAREKGLTFTSPDIISNHFKQLQNISYSGFIDGDMASLMVTNTNHAIVRNITFKVTLPLLANGNYQVNYGDIVRTKRNNNQTIVYIITDIPGDSTKNIIIEPDTPRKSFQLGIPQFPIEGTIEITVKDTTGNPLRDVDVILDSDNYQTDEKGTVHVDLKRGYHTITIQSAGYEKYSSIINVKGRVYIIPASIGEII